MSIIALNQVQGPKVSVFKSYKHNTPSHNINIWDWLSDVSRKSDIDYLRTINNKDEIRKIKEQLPCITPSGEFNGRSVSGLIKHSGLICIDIDANDNPHISDYNKLREELKKISNIAYCALSASGRGVFCLIPIKFPERHKEHFKSLQLAFKNLQIIIDKSCSDVSRLRGYSYDSGAYINKNATVFELLHQDAQLPITTKDVRETTSHVKNVDNTADKVSKLISVIESKCIDITETYEQWFQIGCALANEFGEDGRDYYHSLSQFHNEYSTNRTDAMFNSCLENEYNYSIGTLFYLADNYGLL